MWQPPPSPIPPEDSLWRELIARIKAAEAPLLLLGRGCRDAKTELHRFLLKCSLPFATTMQGKGIALHDSIWNLGVLGVGGSPRANTWQSDHCDLVVAIGTSLNEFTTQGFKSLPREGVGVVRIDIDPSVFSTTPYSEINMVADARVALHKLTNEEWNVSPTLRSEVNALRGRIPPFSFHERLYDCENRVAPMDVIDLLSEIAPPDTHFVADSGNNALWVVHRLILRENQDFHIDINTGCMGSGVVSAVGLQAALPHVPVVALCGDGGAMMLGNEISTAVDARLPVIWVILNDSKLGMVRQALSRMFDNDWECQSFSFDISAWAKAIGARTVTASNAGCLAEELQRAFRERSGPVVIDVRVNDLYLPSGYGRLQRSPEEEKMYQASQSMKCISSSRAEVLQA